MFGCFLSFFSEYRWWLSFFVRVFLFVVSGSLLCGCVCVCFFVWVVGALCGGFGEFGVALALFVAFGCDFLVCVCFLVCFGFSIGLFCAWCGVIYLRLLGWCFVVGWFVLPI